MRNVTNSPVAENIVGKWVAGSSLAIHQTELIKDTFPSRASSELLSAGIGELGAGSIECLASHDLRAWSSEDGYLCSMFHGPLQLQIRTAFLLPARLFPTVARQSATPSLNYLSPPKDHLLPARFCSHFQLVSRLYIAVLPLWPSSSPPQAGCCRRPPLYYAVNSQLVRLGRRYAYPGR